MTVVIAIISSVAGLLLIISLAMCIFFMVQRRRRTPPASSHQKFVLPRAHLPTLGTVNRNFTDLDTFSLGQTYDDQFVDASDSISSSANTTYNATYRTNGTSPEADFGIFDELESRIPISRGHIPRPQMIDMLGTLNSLPSQIRFDEPSGAAPPNPFSDSHDLDDVELVTDMLEDMTRDDETQDDFVEALNPNFILPRLVLPPEERSSKWLTVNSPLLIRRS